MAFGWNMGGGGGFYRPPANRGSTPSGVRLGPIDQARNMAHPFGGRPIRTGPGRVLMAGGRGLKIKGPSGGSRLTAPVGRVPPGSSLANALEGARNQANGQAPSPYDATYYNNLAAATLRANNQINAYNTDIANSQTNLQNAQNQLAYMNRINTENAQNAENARGGFAQGALGHQLGEINHQFLFQQSQNQQKVAQQDAAWRQAIAGVQQGLSIEQIALGLASAARQAALTANNPAAGPGAGPAGGAPGIGGVGAPPGGGGSNRGVNRPPRVVRSRTQPSSTHRGGGRNTGHRGGHGVRFPHPGVGF